MEELCRSYNARIAGKYAVHLPSLHPPKPGSGSGNRLREKIIFRHPSNLIKTDTTGSASASLPDKEVFNESLSVYLCKLSA